MQYITKPEFVAFISKTLSIIFPVSVKILRSIGPTLKDLWNKSSVLFPLLALKTSDEVIA